jgi:tetratricopeptide (TPR) repeat protein
LIKRVVFCFAVSLICFSPFLSSSSTFANQNSLNGSLSRIEQEFLHQRLSKASLAELISIVNEYPTSSRAHIVLGNCCDAMGLPEQAMEQYKLAFKYSPDNVQSILELVKAQIRAGQLSAASSLLKQAMERFPTDPQILFWTGNALFKEQRYNEARELYVQAINKSKKPIVGINSALGNLSLLEERYSNALALAMTDLAYDPNLPLANEVAGLAFLKIGKFEHAVPYLAIAYKSDPTNYNIAINYARSLIWCGKYNDAIMPVLSAMAIAPNFIDRNAVTKITDDLIPHLSKASICDRADQISSLSALNKNVFVHLELAKMCLKRNLPQLALKESLLAVKLDPHSADAKYKLALVTENYEHDYPTALRYLREAKVLDPYNYEITQHLSRLEDRLTINKSDWAWHLKDWLRTYN